MTEYVEKLFELATTYGHPNLTKFGELVNDEMWWVVTEIVSEQNVGKRIKLMKQFIKVNPKFSNAQSLFKKKCLGLIQFQSETGKVQF